LCALQHERGSLPRGRWREAPIPWTSVILAANRDGFTAVGKVNLAHDIVQAAGYPVIERHAGQVSYVHRIPPQEQGETRIQRECSGLSIAERGPSVIGPFAIDAHPAIMTVMPFFARPFARNAHHVRIGPDAMRI